MINGQCVCCHRPAQLTDEGLCTECANIRPGPVMPGQPVEFVPAFTGWVKTESGLVNLSNADAVGYISYPDNSGQESFDIFARFGNTSVQLVTAVPLNVCYAVMTELTARMGVLDLSLYRKGA